LTLHLALCCVSDVSGPRPASRLACPISQLTLLGIQPPGLGACASCLRCLLVPISPFYEHRPCRIATAETRVLEDKTLIGAMVEIDANVEAFHVIDELGWDCRAAEVAKVGCDFHG